MPKISCKPGRTPTAAEIAELIKAQSKRVEVANDRAVREEDRLLDLEQLQDAREECARRLERLGLSPS